MKLYLYLAVIFGIAFLSAFALTDSEIDEFKNDIGEVEVFPAKRPGILVLTSNGIPDHETETVNPHEVQEQAYVLRFPKDPEAVVSDDDVGCLPPIIGFAVNGVPFFSLSTSGELDAVLTETFDSCGGHPDPNDKYHYHGMPNCLMDQRGNSSLVGVALDGFPIYGNVDADTGAELFSADLDICHGRYVDGEYRYHMTADYPYILGCYRGDDLSLTNSNEDNPNCEVYGGRTEIKRDIVLGKKGDLWERFLKNVK